MQFKTRFGAMTYTHGPNGLVQSPLQRIEAWTHEDAAQLVAGEGLTLSRETKMQGVAYLVAKVWKGRDFRYVYRYPWTKPTGPAAA